MLNFWSMLIMHITLITTFLWFCCVLVDPLNINLNGYLKDQGYPFSFASESQAAQCWKLYSIKRELLKYCIHGSLHCESNWITVQQDVTLFSLLYFCKQLYMFRVLAPIIRSLYNLNYSFWHWAIGSATIFSGYWVWTRQHEQMGADGSRPSWPGPEVVITVVQAPDDGCQHPKHVELSTDM